MAERWQQWMPFYIDRFRGSPDVQAMHPCARIGYLYLLSSAWQTEDCTIPTDPIDLATLSGLGDELWEQYSARIMRKFDRVDGTNRMRNSAEYTEWLDAKRVFEARQAAARKTTQTRSPSYKSTVTVTDLFGDCTVTDTVTDGAPLRSADTQTITGTYTETDINTNTPSSPPALVVQVRPEEFANLWNRHRGTLPKVQDFTDERRKKVLTRMKSGLTIERFQEAVENCRVKPFLRGDNDSGWTATFDWLIKNSTNVQKAIENPYGLNAGGKKPNGKIETTLNSTAVALANLRVNGTGEHPAQAIGDLMLPSGAGVSGISNLHVFPVIEGKR